jgi:hypothetical protein
MELSHLLSPLVNSLWLRGPGSFVSLDLPARYKYRHGTWDHPAGRGLQPVMIPGVQTQGPEKSVSSAEDILCTGHTGRDRCQPAAVPQHREIRE